MPRFIYTFFTLLATVFLSFFSLETKAQRPIKFEMKWKYGTLVLNNGDTIRGEVSISLQHDLVVITQNGTPITSTLPVNIKSLEVNEELVKVAYRLTNGPLQQRRLYQSFIWDHDNAYSNFRAPALFVVLVSGKNTLVMREERYEKAPGPNLTPNLISAVAGPAAGGLTQMGMNQFNLTEKFYLLAPGKNLKWLRIPKKDLAACFPEKKKEIMQFANQNNLSFSKPEHLARIVEFCNRFE